MNLKSNLRKKCLEQNRLLVKKKLIIHNFGNVTSIMVTHELKTVYDVADRVIMLDKKKVIFDGKPNELIHSNKPIIQEFIGSGNIAKENND